MKLKTAIGSTKGTKTHENLKHYRSKRINQTGYAALLCILLILLVYFVSFVDNCFFQNEADIFQEQKDV